MWGSPHFTPGGRAMKPLRPVRDLLSSASLIPSPKPLDWWSLGTKIRAGLRASEYPSYQICERKLKWGYFGGQKPILETPLMSWEKLRLWYFLKFEKCLTSTLLWRTAIMVASFPRDTPAPLLLLPQAPRPPSLSVSCWRWRELSLSSPSYFPNFKIKLIINNDRASSTWKALTPMFEVHNNLVSR